MDFLEAQQTLTAVDRFSEHHSDGLIGHQAIYSDLIPASAPGVDEQYAFEVDLDACSGCKSCVTACHSLNDLETDELWRKVGLLHGGTTELPVLQHVTTSCHHCIEPACLDGCPVKAYEKDDDTGIVRHLDDQCIGCQYCILKCPYDVPRYSSSKGIVRKCDMCQDKLSKGQAPACVQACPNQAIRIRTVNTHSIVEETEANIFLPGAPEPGYTIPTTVYKTSRPLPRNLLPADYYSSRPQHGHFPLVVMLVLTQMSVGAFVIDQMMGILHPFEAEPVAARLIHLAAALFLGLLGLTASIFHLGRPLYAFRAILGLKTSWLSREIVAFGVFAASATAYVLIAGVEYTTGGSFLVAERALGLLAACSGLVGVFCSVMIYVDTRRPFWSGPLTGTKFMLTMIVLGLPTALLISLLSALWPGGPSTTEIMSDYGYWMCRCLVITVTIKLLFEALIFTSLRHKQHTPLKRTALLLCGELSMIAMQRFFFGFVGGIVLPLVLLNETVLTDGFHWLFTGITTLLIIALISVGELMERYLFFRAVIAPKMPGSPAT